MSSTNRGAARQPDDYYRTPAWAVRAVLPHIDWTATDCVLDPAAGDGAILNAVTDFAPTLTTRGIELDADRGEAARSHGHSVAVGDALAMPWGRPGVIIANPPYSLAQAFLERALAEVEPGGEVAFLLRLAWMAGQKRATFHREHPSDVFVLPRRPSFTGKGTDSADYAWFAFGPGRGGRWSVLDVGREAA